MRRNSAALAVVHTRDFESAIDEETLLVSVTHVSYRMGERLPVEEITRLAHERRASSSTRTSPPGRCRWTSARSTSTSSRPAR